MTGCRMMVERVQPRSACELLALLGVDGDHQDAARALAVAHGYALPLIVGWDDSGASLMAKLYLNASDLSTRVRETVRRELAPEARSCPASPHVLGFNFVGAKTTVKAYTQVGALGDAAPSILRKWARGLDCSGFVRSVDLRDGFATDRAWFASPRPTASLEGALHRLHGFTEAAATEVSPFVAGPVTSVGFSADGSTWTLYFKPRCAAAPSWSLDPDVCVAREDAELGIYLEPVELARRAYARTGSSALSYRIREGQPDGAAVERVMAWVIERVLESERTDFPIDFSHPPEPWRVVGSR